VPAATSLTAGGSVLYPGSRPVRCPGCCMPFERGRHGYRVPLSGCVVSDCMVRPDHCSGRVRASVSQRGPVSSAVGPVSDGVAVSRSPGCRAPAVSIPRSEQSRHFQTWREHREQAHVSTEQPSPGQGPRFPPSHAHPGRSFDPFGSPPQGPQRDLGLICCRPTPDRHVVLPAGSRLRTAADFAAVVKGGRRAGTKRLVVHYLPRMHGGSPRAGFVVSAKVGNSVIRHRVTRRLRALAGEQLGSLPSGSALVVRALPAAATATSVELGTDLRSGLASAVRKATGVKRSAPTRSSTAAKDGGSA